VIVYCKFGGVLSLLYGSIFNDGPMKTWSAFTTPIDFREMQSVPEFPPTAAISTRSTTI